ncbi:MAG TPA: GNAT family N-acetyltransferase [Pseudonocardiaceae bacterium]
MKGTQQRSAVSKSIDVPDHPGQDRYVDARLHHDLADFVTLTHPLLQGDPVRHTIALSALDQTLRVPEIMADPPVLLTVHRGDLLAGAAVCTPPHDLIVSALPPECADAAVELLARRDAGVPGVVGPRDEAAAFARSWSARTGASVHERMAMRLFALHQLTPPNGVRGAARQAGDGDIELLAQWRADFSEEATGGLRGHGTALQQTQRSLAAGGAALLWEVAGKPVAWASTRVPVVAMSRIGPVYTPPQHRGQGYGTAVTASAASWAQQAGAEHVLLFTDLANPITNTIYPRIGFRPVHDAVEIAFTPASRSQSGDRTH